MYNTQNNALAEQEKFIDDAGNVFGVHFRLGGILHQADHLGKTCLFHGGPDRILDLQDKGFVIRSQASAFPVQTASAYHGRHREGFP